MTSIPLLLAMSTAKLMFMISGRKWLFSQSRQFRPLECISWLFSRQESVCLTQWAISAAAKSRITITKATTLIVKPSESRSTEGSVKIAQSEIMGMFSPVGKPAARTVRQTAEPGTVHYFNAVCFSNV